MKRVIIWILGIAAIGAAAVVALLSRVDADFVVRQIAEATAKATGKPLRFDAPPSISFLPPGVHFGQTSWGDPADNDGLYVSVKGGMAQIELGPLLSGNIVVREVRLDNPILEARQNSDKTEAAPKQEKPSKPSASQTGAAASSLPIELKRLVIRQGAVVYDDAKGQSLHLNDVNLSVENLRTGAEAVVQCDFSFDLQQTEAKAAAQTATGTLAFSSHLRFAERKLSFRQTALTVTPLSGLLPKEAGPLQLTCEGTLGIDDLQLQLDKAWLATPQARLGLTGEAQLAEPSFNGVVELEGSSRKLASLAGMELKPLPQSVKDGLKLKSSMRFTPASLRLDQLQMQIDDVPINGNLSLGLSKTDPISITADMQVGMLNLDNYLPLPGAAEKSGRDERRHAAAKSVGATTDSKASKPAENMPSLDLRAKVDGVRKGGLVVKNIVLAVKGEKGRYTLAPFGCALGTGGAINGTGSVDMSTNACAVKATASGVEIGALLEALGKGRTADGQAALDVDVAMKCASADAMLNSLAGRGLLEIRRLYIPAMSSLSKNVAAITGKDGALPDRFDLARVPFTAREGEVDAAPITVTSSGLNATGKAHISLPRQHLEAAMDVKTLGMTIPVTAKGPLADISFGIDPRFALDMAKKLPGALIDTGKNAGDGAGGLLKQGAKGAGGVVKGLLGR